MKRLIFVLIFALCGTAYSAGFFPEQGTGVTTAVLQLLKDTKPDQKYVFIDDMAFRVSDLEKSGFSGPAWTNGNVYYTFDPNVTADQRNAWIDAADNWSETANVTFHAWSGQSNYIYVFSGSGNWSWVGMLGGRQDMSIFNWNSEFVMTHEVGHALGMFHEHCRGDRDTYISVSLANIQDDFEHNFTISGGDVYGFYDFDSIMHYNQCAFSIDCAAGASCDCTNKPIIVLPPYQDWQDEIGQRDHLSYWDECGMAARYGAPPSDDIYVDSNATGAELGTHCFPYHTLDAALAAALSGDSIAILGGNHAFAPVTINQYVTLYAEDGNATIN